jgi:nucleoside-diphosphate-sugar epimerase
MRILLTGAHGFLGRHVMDYFQGHHIVDTLGRSNTCHYKCNLAHEVPALNEKFDLVIHAAGKAHLVPRNPVEEEDFFKVNYRGTINLLKAFKGQPLQAFIFISTVAVYGLNEGHNISESTSLLATDPYGHSKIKAEELVQEWCAKNKVVCTILRLPLVVGANPPGNLSALIRGIKKGYYFNIDGGKAKKSMVLAEDVAKFVLKAAEVGGIFNLTDGYHPSFAELSNHISIQLGKGKPMNMPIWLAKIIAKFGDLLGIKAPLNNNKLKKITSDLTFDDSKAREAFGWNPTPVLKGFKLNTNAQ